jgi:hypothetical protein
MITYNFQGHEFVCYTREEFAAEGMRKSHRAVSNTFVPSEGLLLDQWLRFFPDGVLVSNGRDLPRITVYAPRKEAGAKKRSSRHQRRCGAGAGQLEGLSGSEGDTRAYYDVLYACRRKLREWEEAGVVQPDALAVEFRSNYTNSKDG